MVVRSRDIPQAPRLARVREVVDAVAAGATSVAGVGDRTGMLPRDARYHLNAATRVLSLLREDKRAFGLTDAGRALSRTKHGSEQERALLIDAVSDSSVVRELAGELLGVRGPRHKTVIARMQKAGLSTATAERRASDLLGWRKQLVEEQGRLFPEERPTGGGGVRDVTARPLAPHREPAARTPMLTSLRLCDFKSFADETIQLGALTVFVGANASGKSNALDAIRFLQGLALELPISDILRGHYEGGREIWPAIRGGIPEIARGGRSDFRICSAWHLDGSALTHEIRCTTKPVPVLHRESLVGADMGQYLFDTHAKTVGTGAGILDGRAIKVALKGTGGKNPTQTHSAASSLMGQLQASQRVQEVVYDRTAALQNAMKAATFLNISPLAMRDYAPAAALDLGADGRNVSAIVKTLCDQPGGTERLVDWLSELCAPRVTSIEFVDTGLGDVMLQLVEEDGSKVSARSLSDGTLRFLGELVALQTVPTGSILLIEEIENGLHPQRMHLLVELLEGVVKERGIQVIVTTHSPLVLAALSAQALSQAVVFARVDGHEGTLARRLGELPKFEEIASRRGVDRLFASGWLERAL